MGTALQAFKSKVFYRPGQQNIADSLSRMRQPSLTNQVVEFDVVYQMMRGSVLTSVMARGVEQASASDSKLVALCQCVLSGDWLRGPNQAYHHNELCVRGHVILRSDRIVMPASLQDHVVKLAH